MSGLSKVIVLDPDPRAARQVQLGFAREGVQTWLAPIPVDATKLQLFPPGDKDPDASLVLVGGSVELIKRARALLEAAHIDVPVVFAGRDGVRRTDAEAAGADEVVLQPAHLRDVVTIGRILRGAPLGHRSHLVGSLAETTGVFTLVRALSALGRSAVLTLIRGLRRGEVRFFHGEVTSAQVGLIHGQAALHQLLLWTDARFDFHHEDIVRRHQIPLARDELFADAARFLAIVRDESGPLSPSNVLEQDVARVHQLGKLIPTEVHGVLRMFDGHRVLADVLEDSPYRVFETLRVAQRALDVGLLRQAAAPRPKATWRAVLAIEEWLVGNAQVDRERDSGPIQVDSTEPQPKQKRRDRKKRRANTPLAVQTKPDIDWGALVPRIVGAEVGPLSGVVPAAQASGEILLPSTREEPREKLEALMDTGKRERIFPRDVGLEPSVVWEEPPPAPPADVATADGADELAKRLRRGKAEDTERIKKAELEAVEREVEAELAAKREVEERARAEAARVEAEVAAAVEAERKAKAEQAAQAEAEAAASAKAAREAAEAEVARVAAEAEAKVATERKAREDEAARIEAEAAAEVAATLAAKRAAEESARAEAAQIEAEAEAKVAADREAARAEAARRQAEAEAKVAAEREAADKAEAEAKAAAEAKAREAADASAAAGVEAKLRADAEHQLAEHEARMRADAAAAEEARKQAELREREETERRIAADAKARAAEERRAKTNAEAMIAADRAEADVRAELAKRDTGKIDKRNRAVRRRAEAEQKAITRARAEAIARVTAQSAGDDDQTLPRQRVEIPVSASDLVKQLIADDQSVPVVETPAVVVAETANATVTVGDQITRTTSAETARLVATPIATITEVRPEARNIPEGIDPEASDGIPRTATTGESAPLLRRRPPSVEEIVDDRPEDKTGEITAPLMREDRADAPAEPSILVSDLAAVHSAVSAVAVAQAAASPPVSAATPSREHAVANIAGDASTAFSDIEEEFFRTGHEPTPGGKPEDTFADLDEGYERVGFWDKLLGRKKPPKPIKPQKR